MPQLYTFDDKASWSTALSDQIIRHLMRALEKKGLANLIVPGGTTPAPVFKQLAAQPINWLNVSIMPSDERWVDETHEQSNYRLLKNTLVTDKASVSELCSLKTDHDTAEQAAPILSEQLADKLAYNACTVIGMGPDGHFASLFPQLANLEQALTLNNQYIKNKQAVVPAYAKGSEVAGEYPERISLSLAALIDSPLVMLMVTGDAKLKLIKELLAGEHQDLPVAQLLNQGQTPVEIYWTA
jgi:6-phosphogluconolactonase